MLPVLITPNLRVLHIEAPGEVWLSEHQEHYARFLSQLGLSLQELILATFSEQQIDVDLISTFLRQTPKVIRLTIDLPPYLVNAIVDGLSAANFLPALRKLVIVTEIFDGKAAMLEARRVRPALVCQCTTSLPP